MAPGGYYPAREDPGEDVEIALVWGSNESEIGR